MTRTARAVLGWIVLVAALGTLVALRSPAQAGAQTDAAQLDRGRLLYANQCAACHGAGGQGGTVPGTDAEAPALAGNPEVTVAYLDLVMRVGRMPPPANAPFDNRARNVVLSDEDRLAVIAFAAEEFGIDGEIPQPPAGDASRGRQVYATNCAQCHGSTAEGGVAGAGAWTPPVVGLDPVAVAEAVRVGPFEMPGFSEDIISDAELGDLAAFLTEIEHESGTPLGLVELNPVFASGFALLFTVVVVLAMMGVAGRPTWFPDPKGQRRTEEDT